MNRNSSGVLSSPTPSHSDIRFKDIPLEPFGRGQEVEHNSVASNASSIPRDAQAGVKNIEAVSMAWTKWGLTAAYAR